MKRKCIVTCILTLFIYGLTACGSPAATEQVVAMEPEVIVIRDEPEAPLVKEPLVTEQKSAEKKALHLAEVTAQEEFIVLSSEQVTAEPADANVDETDFVAKVRGTDVYLNGEINRLMPLLGMPEQFSEEINSRGDGSNKHYVYGDVVVHTEPESGRDIVKRIELGGEQKTLSGMGIGCTRADIEAAYGIEYVMDPEHLIYIYMEEYMLSFRMEGEMCIGIELSVIENV